ncbi:UNVERIFIED_ORG: hypothetical protein GGE53_006375 [Rhizobium etli]
MICAQQSLIDGMRARGEPSGLASERLVKLTEDLRSHCFHQDLIQASIRLEPAAAHGGRSAGLVLVHSPAFSSGSSARLSASRVAIFLL